MNNSMINKKTSSNNAIALNIISKQLKKIERAEMSFDEKIKILVSLCERDLANGEKAKKQLTALLVCAKQIVDAKNNHHLLIDLIGEDADDLKEEIQEIRNNERVLNEELLQFCSSINILCDMYGLQQAFSTSDANVIWPQIINYVSETGEEVK